RRSPASRETAPAFGGCSSRRRRSGRPAGRRRPDGIAHQGRSCPLILPLASHHRHRRLSPHRYTHDSPAPGFRSRRFPPYGERMTSVRTMRFVVLTLILFAGATVAGPARAIDLGRLAGKAAGAAAGGARDKVASEVNAKLLAEGRKNQCSF